MLVGNQSDRYSHHAKSMAIYNLKNIRSMTNAAAGDVSSKAHKQHLSTLIDNALKEIK
jgi:hypothetical protein